MELRKLGLANTFHGNPVSSVSIGEGRGTVKLPGRRGAWCGPATILMQEKRRVGNVESMTGVVSSVPPQSSFVQPAERVGEVQHTNLDVFTQVVDNLPNVVAVDLTGQIGPIEENIHDDMIMDGPPHKTDPASEPESVPEPASDQDALVSESDQELPVSVPDQGLLVFEVAQQLHSANPIRNGLNPILMRRHHRRLKRRPLLLARVKIRLQLWKTTRNPSLRNLRSFNIGLVHKWNE